MWKKKNNGYRLQATGYRLQASGHKEACDLRPATDNGFTLIEVMIAIAIIAIALVVILHSYGLE